MALAFVLTLALTGPRIDLLLGAGVLAIAVLAAGLALGSAPAVTAAIVLLACQFVLALADRELPGVFAAAIAGAALLAIAELAFWSLELRLNSRGEPGLWRRRGLQVAGLGVASLAVGFVAAMLSQAPVAGGPGLLLAGSAAIVLAIALVTVLVLRAGSRGG